MEKVRPELRVLEITVKGESMLPALSPGCRVRIERVARERYAIGEIVAFPTGGTLVVHRVVGGPARGHLLTRGDAALLPDDPVSPGHVVGPVTGVRRDDRWVMPPAAASRRSRAGRLFALLGLLAVAAALRLGPRSAAATLRQLHRARRGLLAVRGSRAWR